MGELISFCCRNTKKKEDEDENDIKSIANNHLMPINNVSSLKPSNLKEINTPIRGTQKAHTQKMVKFTIDKNKIDLNQFPKKETILRFSETTNDIRSVKTEDDDNKSQDLDSKINRLNSEPQKEKNNNLIKQKKKNDSKKLVIENEEKNNEINNNKNVNEENENININDNLLNINDENKENNEINKNKDSEMEN